MSHVYYHHFSRIILKYKLKYLLKNTLIKEEQAYITD